MTSNNEQLKFNEKPEFEYIDSKNLLEEGKLFEYKGKVLLVHKNFINNYNDGLIDMVPFIHDISFDLKEHVPNKNLTGKEALKKLQYVGAKVLYASNEQDRPLIKKVQKLSVNRNHEGLEKFCTYLTRELSASDLEDVTLSDEENGLFFNALDQGFAPSKMRKKYCRCSETIDDVFYK